MQEQVAPELQLPVNWGRLWHLHRASLTPQQIAAVQQGTYYVPEPPSSSAECCLTVAPQLLQSCSVATDANAVSMLLMGPAEQQPVVTRQSVRVSLAPVVTTAVVPSRESFSPQLPVSVPAGTPALAQTAGGAPQMHGHQYTSPLRGQAAVHPGHAALPGAVALAQLHGFGNACWQQDAAGPCHAASRVPLHPRQCCDDRSSPASAGNASPAATPSIGCQQQTQLYSALNQGQSSRQSNATATVPALYAAEPELVLASDLLDELELQQLLLAMTDDMSQPDFDEQLDALGLVAQP